MPGAPKCPVCGTVMEPGVFPYKWQCPKEDKHPGKKYEQAPHAQFPRRLPQSLRQPDVVVHLHVR